MFYLSLIDIELRNFNEARILLEKLTSLDSSNKKFHYFLSVVDLETGDKHKALTVLKELMNAESSNGLAHYSRRIIANEYIKESNFSDALTLLEQLV